MYPINRPGGPSTRNLAAEMSLSKHLITQVCSFYVYTLTSSYYILHDIVERLLGKPSTGKLTAIQMRRIFKQFLINCPELYTVLVSIYIMLIIFTMTDSHTLKC